MVFHTAKVSMPQIIITRSRFDGLNSLEHTGDYQLIYHLNMTFITLYYDYTSIPADARCFFADFGSFQRISVIGCISVFLVTPQKILSPKNTYVLA